MKNDINKSAVEILNEYASEGFDLELHMERNLGTNSAPFSLWSGDDELFKGVLDLETDESGDYTDIFTAQILTGIQDGDYTEVWEYDSLVARTNPGKLR